MKNNFLKILTAIIVIQQLSVSASFAQQHYEHHETTNNSANNAIVLLLVMLIIVIAGLIVYWISPRIKKQKKEKLPDQESLLSEKLKKEKRIEEAEKAHKKQHPFSD